MENVVIMQHVIPQNNPPIESQEEQSKYVPADMPKPLVKFFQGEPEVLGVTQLSIGINHIFFGIIFTIISYETRIFFLQILVDTGVVFWSGILYIISGSLSIAASYKPTVGKVNASLTLNIISCIAAGISVILFAAFLSNIPRFGSYYYNNNYCAYYKQSQICEGDFMPQVCLRGIGATLLLFTALQICIALSTAIFGCKTVCRTSYSDMNVVIYHTTSVSPLKPALSTDGEVKIH
ncbi:membrane-spanning 4-domains subfamily A member 4A-like [Rhinoderma darwinii]|uniref:membrane-spanning 4-domains subfamily A member 4A-like n=1 Tax=Rhinoderma darwinii TaxID=43563 RepID=UPI003F661BA7